MGPPENIPTRKGFRGKENSGINSVPPRAPTKKSFIISKGGVLPPHRGGGPPHKRDLSGGAIVEREKRISSSAGGEGCVLSFSSFCSRRREKEPVS